MHLKMMNLLNEIGQDLNRDGLSVYFHAVPVWDLQIHALTGGQTTFIMTVNLELVYQSDPQNEMYPQAFRLELKGKSKTSTRISMRCLKKQISPILTNLFLLSLIKQKRMDPIETTQIRMELIPLISLPMRRSRFFAKLCENYLSQEETLYSLTLNNDAL